MGFAILSEVLTKSFKKNLCELRELGGLQSWRLRGYEMSSNHLILRYKHQDVLLPIEHSPDPDHCGNVRGLNGLRNFFDA